MPIFEFECQTCGSPFEELIRNGSAIDQVICPDCGSLHVRKKVSKVAAKISGKGSFSLGASAASSCSTGST